MMRKLIILFSVLIGCAINANAQGVTRDQYCVIIGGDGDVISFGCPEHFELVGSLYVCFDNMIIKNPFGNILYKSELSVVGEVIYNDKIIPFNEVASFRIYIIPNEVNTISIEMSKVKNITNVKFNMSISITLTDNGESIVDINNWKFECL